MFLQRGESVVGHEARSELNAALVHDEIGAMEVAEGSARLVDADAEIARRNLVGEEGEILGGHAEVEPFHIVLAQVFYSVVVDRLGAVVVVDDRQVAIVDEKVALATHTLGHALGDFADFLVGFEAPLGVEGADDALHLDFVGDDVGAALAQNAAEAEHRGHHGGSVAADHLLERHDDVAGDDDGVDAEMRGCAVTAFALDRPVEFVGRGHVAALLHAHLAIVHLGEAMERIHLVGGDLVEEAIVHHHAGAARVHFLGGFEHQHDRAAELGAEFGENLGGAEERAGVHVVAAGVHDARVFGGKVEASVLGEGERVIVGAEADAIAIRLDGTADHGHAARAADTGVRFEAEGTKRVGDKVHGAEFLLRKFGVAVEPTTIFDDFGRISVRYIFYAVYHNGVLYKNMPWPH